MKNENVLYIMENYQTKTDKEIAAFVGCHPSTIKHYRLDFGLLKRKTTISSCIHSEQKMYALGMCRSCYEKNLKIRNIGYAQRQILNNKEWSNLNKDRVKENDKRYVSENLSKVRKNKWLWRIKNKYNILESDYLLLMTKQNNCCAICSKVPKYKLVVDHNHITNNNRGLLCRQCNLLLGLLGDNIEKTKCVLSYLEQYKELDDIIILHKEEQEKKKNG